ncbi:unnamed protein product, partial [Gongylonema pulchrum]|uniref:PAM2 domain-containing protein n=1 Tax=Gongylonema pulchrum TaxID=637853 RepID=A0A183CZR2_9BILA
SPILPTLSGAPTLQHVKTLPSCFIAPVAPAPATLFPSPAFGLNPTTNFLNCPVLYPAAAAAYATLIPADAHSTFLYHPTVAAANNSHFQQQYSSFTPSVTSATAFLTGNILQTAAEAALNSTSSNKRKSTTIYSTKSESKLYGSGSLATLTPESPSRTPVNHKKTCVKLDCNPVCGPTRPEGKRVDSSAAACMAASPVRPVIGQQQSQQQIAASDIAAHYQSHPFEQSQLAVASSAVKSQQLFKSMEQMRQSQMQSQDAQQQQQQQQMV